MLQIKEDDKFYSRLLSKESSLANPSFRVYYGGVSVTVPFVWEAKPGTPKHTKHVDHNNNKNNQETENNNNTISLPPLTPPPSYTTTSSQAQSKIKSAHNKKPNKFQGLFPKMLHRRSVSSSSSFSSSFGSGSDFRSLTRSSQGSLFDFIEESDQQNHHELVGDQEIIEEEEMTSSPKSTLCFGSFRGGSRKIRSCSILDH